eukprot:15022497-Ditylum_brightwellii.AAC.1
MHGHNKTHNTEDCFELKWHVKHAKPDKMQKDADKKKEKEVKLNIFDKFHTLNIESSNEEDKPNMHAPTNVDNDDTSASCLLSDTDNDSNNK